MMSMADVRGTKTHQEKMDDEAERLIRHSPKQKPPRHDKHREHMVIETDKSAMTERLVTRATEWVKVRNKDKDQVTRVTPETLKDHPELYEKVPKNEPDNQDGIRPPRKPQKPAKPHYHKDHLPHEKWPDPRPMPETPPRAPRPTKPLKPLPVPEAPKDEHEPKEKPPGWVEKPRDLKASLVDRWLRQADDESGLVSVRRKEDGKVVRIKRDTLKEAPSDYEKVEDEEEKAPAPEAPAKPKPKPAPAEGKPAPAPATPEEKAERGEKLRDVAKDNPALDALFRAMVDPKSKEYTTFRGIGNLPAATVLKGVNVEGVKTVQDVLDALASPAPKPGKKKPEPKPEAAPAPAQPAPAQPAPPAAQVPPPAEQPAAPGQPAPAPATAPGQAAPPASAPAQPTPGAPAPAAPGAPAPVAPKEPEKPKEPRDPKPARPRATAQEMTRAQTVLTQSLGPKRAEKLLASGMHPHDAERVAALYDQAKKTKLTLGKLDGYVKDAKSFYELDPAKIKPPATAKNAAGEDVPYDQLSPPEQQEAWQQHRNQVVAMSLAVRRQVYETFRRSGAPKKLAAAMTHARLGTAKAAEAAADLFDKTVNDGATEKLPLGKIRGILESTTDPAMKEVAAAYVQARSYQQARRLFLDPSSPRAISERMSPAEIGEKLVEATGYLREHDDKLPDGVMKQNLAQLFRNRVFSTLAKVEPKKASRLLKVMDKLDAEEYRVAEKKHKQAHEDWAAEAAHRSSQREKLKAETGEKEKAWKAADPAKRGDKPPSFKDSLKALGLDEKDDPAAPPPPVKPPRYDSQGKSAKEQEEESRRIFEQLTKGTKSKTASLLVGRALALSTCGLDQTMAQTSRTAVYWGVDPYPQNQSGAPYHYAPWSQAAARDLDESDYTTIEASAKQWLTSPVLSKDIEGMVPDARFRAALDLAIRTAGDGRYSAGLHPALYDRLLAKLAGVPGPDKGTLTTILAAESTYSGRESAMTPSQTLRQYAQRIASTNPSIAFDLLDLSDKLAQEQSQQEKQAQDQQDQGQKQAQTQQQDQGKQAQDQQGQEQQKQAQEQQDGQQKQAYLALKSACVKQAHDNPTVRAAFLPILELIKRQG